MSFPKYEAYKDSGVEWLGEVPKHWNVKKLGFIGEAIIGLTYSPDDVVNEDEGILVLRSSNVQDGKISFQNNIFVNKLIPSKLVVREDDILICSRNGSRELIGKNALIDKNSEGMTFGAFMTVFRSQINQFLFWIFNSYIFSAQAGSFMTSTVNQLTTGTLNSFLVPVPPLEEQTQIARFLDHETARIDALIAEQERLIELLKEKRQAVISHAVTKGCDSTVPMKDSGVEWLGEVPAHWEVCRLKNISTIVDCKNRTPEYVDNGEFLVVRTSNVKEQRLNLEGAYYTDRKNFEIWTERGIPPVGSILFTREAPTGEVCLVPDGIPLCMGQRMMNIIPDDPGITSFLFDFLTSDCLTKYIESQSAGSTVTHLRVEQVYNIPIVVPPQDEQAEIDELVRKMKKQFSDLVEIAHKSIALLQERRSALISAAVTGKIDVRGWQPPASDAPAATLEAAYG